MMPAPRGRTRQPTRKLTVWAPPYLEEWVRAEAERRFPDAPKRGLQSQVNRLLRGLLEELYDQAEEPD